MSNNEILLILGNQLFPLEYIEKNNVHALLAENAAILGAKVGFTN